MNSLKINEVLLMLSLRRKLVDGRMDSINFGSILFPICYYSLYLVVDDAMDSINFESIVVFRQFLFFSLLSARDAQIRILLFLYAVSCTSATQLLI